MTAVLAAAMLRGVRTWDVASLSSGPGLAAAADRGLQCRMPRTLDQFFRSAAAGLSGSHRELLPEDVAVAFVVEGQGGGRWFLRRDGRAARIVPEPAEGVDARLQCSVADFEALIDGSLDGREGFLNGKLRIEGDVGLILALQGAFVGR